MFVLPTPINGLAYGVVTDWLTAIGTLAAVVAALVLAIFHEHLRQWLWRPKLEILLENRPPDCHLTVMTNLATREQADCYYFRIRVRNSGKASAENVQVFIEEVREQRADGTFESWTEFLPLNLLWAHYRNIDFPSIPPSVYKHCDLGHILSPTKRSRFPGEDHNRISGLEASVTVFSLDLAVKPATGTYLLRPGRYRIVLVAAGSNGPLVRRTIELSLTGQWFSEETQMLTQGVGLRPV